MLPYSTEPAEIDLKAFANGEKDMKNLSNLPRVILDNSGSTHRRVFEHDEDRPEEPYLLHYPGNLTWYIQRQPKRKVDASRTAGKGRSGVLAARILSLVNTLLEGIYYVPTCASIELI